MAKSASDPSKNDAKKSGRWAAVIFLITFFVSGVITLLSDQIMSHSGTLAAFLILLAIVAVGILFDTIGVAVTSADERPFHSMAARKVPGAREAILLLRNAERVGSICNDVVGDVCGVVSGSASATIAAQLLLHFHFAWPNVAYLFMSALVAALTVGGKAVGKGIAINSCTQIVYRVGKLIHSWNQFKSLFSRRNKKG